jgi:hypothetical protein
MENSLAVSVSNIRRIAYTVPKRETGLQQDRGLRESTISPVLRPTHIATIRRRLCQRETILLIPKSIVESQQRTLNKDRMLVNAHNSFMGLLLISPSFNNCTKVCFTMD